MPKVQNAVVQGVHSINYYRSFGSAVLAAAATPVANQHFYGQTTLRNDLTDGILPDNRRGEVTAMFMRIRALTTTTTTTFIAAKASVDGLIAFQDVDLKLFINQVEVIRGPIWAFPSPPNWVQGSTTTVAGESFITSQQGGYMLMSIKHEIENRQRVQVRVEGTSQAFTTGTTIPYEVCLQIADFKAA